MGTPAGLRRRKLSRRLATTDPEDRGRNLSTNAIGKWRKELVDRGCSAKWAAALAVRLVAAASRGGDASTRLQLADGETRRVVDGQVRAACRGMPIFLLLDGAEVDVGAWEGAPSADQLSSLVDISDVPAAVFRRLPWGGLRLIMLHFPGALGAEVLGSAEVAAVLREGHLQLVTAQEPSPDTASAQAKLGHLLAFLKERALRILFTIAHAQMAFTASAAIAQLSDSMLDFSSLFNRMAVTSNQHEEAHTELSHVGDGMLSMMTWHSYGDAAALQGNQFFMPGLGLRLARPTDGAVLLLDSATQLHGASPITGGGDACVRICSTLVLSKDVAQECAHGAAEEAAEDQPKEALLLPDPGAAHSCRERGRAFGDSHEANLRGFEAYAASRGVTDPKFLPGGPAWAVADG